ncbi:MULTISPECIES: hypothetical protein [Lysinibacillus]|uniref:Uncharacterized protein n=1 Tax=Lysinibacillus irui TaxID=2998077 RepID=A0AAJ5UVW1_9BACI|nr:MULTISPECIES: hypothetical protein [Lysinibacillus]WDV08878.1 hypothetical protein OU989_10525 [Lysinibacillus irui]
MYKTITFAVDTKYNNPIQETFTFEQLGIDEQLSDIEMKNKLILYLRIGSVIDSIFPIVL